MTVAKGKNVSAKGKGTLVKSKGAPAKSKSAKKNESVAQGNNGSNSTGTDLDKVRSSLELRRKTMPEKVELPEPSPPVSLGPVGAIVDALINTSPDKLLELTDLDRNQVSLIPQVVVVDDMWDYVEQVMQYRTDKSHYETRYKKKAPETPDMISKFVLMLARCRRSLGGKTQKALEDLALADLETRQNDDGMGGIGGHDFED